jgi:TonB-dependent starch-binding outer membrane protein SusC
MAVMPKIKSCSGMSLLVICHGKISTGRPIGSALYYNALVFLRIRRQLMLTQVGQEHKPGDMIFEDVDGDGEITTDDRVRHEMNNFPRFVGGITLGFTMEEL